MQDRITRIEETSCTARPDHTSGSFASDGGPTTLRHVRCTSNSSRIAGFTVGPARSTRAAASAASIWLGAFRPLDGRPSGYLIRRHFDPTRIASRKIAKIHLQLRKLDKSRTALNRDGSSIMTRVLYVEHNDDNIYMLKTRLELVGDFEVFAAGDSEIGCELAVTEHPDVILMDLEMPGIDRWGAVRRLKSDPQTRDIPIIGMSAHALESEREQAIATGSTSSMPNRSNSIAWSQPSGACLRTPIRCSDRGDQDAASPGSRTVKTEPFPGSLVTVTSPPIMRASLRVMARPSPVPPKRCAVVASAWLIPRTASPAAPPSCRCRYRRRQARSNGGRC